MGLCLKQSSILKKSVSALKTLSLISLASFSTTFKCGLIGLLASSQKTEALVALDLKPDLNQEENGINQENFNKFFNQIFLESSADTISSLCEYSQKNDLSFSQYNLAIKLIINKCAVEHKVKIVKDENLMVKLKFLQESLRNKNVILTFNQKFSKNGKNIIVFSPLYFQFQVNSKAEFDIALSNNIKFKTTEPVSVVTVSKYFIDPAHRKALLEQKSTSLNGLGSEIILVNDVLIKKDLMDIGCYSERTLKKTIENEGLSKAAKLEFKKRFPEIRSLSNSFFISNNKFISYRELSSCYANLVVITNQEGEFAIDWFLKVITPGLSSGPADTLTLKVVADSLNRNIDKEKDPVKKKEFMDAVLMLINAQKKSDSKQIVLAKRVVASFLSKNPEMVKAVDKDIKRDLFICLAKSSFGDLIYQLRSTAKAVPNPKEDTKNSSFENKPTQF